MEPIYVQVIPQLIMLAATALVSFIAVSSKGAIQMAVIYMQSKVGTDKFNMLLNYGELVVRDLNQSIMSQGWDGAKKKEAAMIRLQAFVAQNGVKVSVEQLNIICEGLVNTVKVETGIDLTPYVTDVPGLPKSTSKK